MSQTAPVSRLSAHFAEKKRPLDECGSGCFYSAVNSRRIGVFKRRARRGPQRGAPPLGLNSQQQQEGCRAGWVGWGLLQQASGRLVAVRINQKRLLILIFNVRRSQHGAALQDRTAAALKVRTFSC